MERLRYLAKVSIPNPILLLETSHTRSEKVHDRIVPDLKVLRKICDPVPRGPGSHPPRVIVPQQQATLSLLKIREIRYSDNLLEIVI